MGLIYGYIHGLSVDVSMVVNHSHMDDAYIDLIVRIIVFVVVYLRKSLGKTEGAGRFCSSMQSYKTILKSSLLGSGTIFLPVNTARPVLAPAPGLAARFCVRASSLVFGFWVCRQSYSSSFWFGAVFLVSKTIQNAPITRSGSGLLWLRLALAIGTCDSHLRLRWLRAQSCEF